MAPGVLRRRAFPARLAARAKPRHHTEPSRGGSGAQGPHEAAEGVGKEREEG